MAGGARAEDSVSVDAGAASGVESRDDADWKLGMFYYKPSDRSFLVPKRAGIGVTINFRHPAGKFSGIAVIMVLMVALVVVYSI